jgi:hypothetical protein
MPSLKEVARRTEGSVGWSCTEESWLSVVSAAAQLAPPSGLSRASLPATAKRWAGSPGSTAISRPVAPPNSKTGASFVQLAPPFVDLKSALPVPGSLSAA